MDDFAFDNMSTEQLMDYLIERRKHSRAESEALLKNARAVLQRITAIYERLERQENAKQPLQPE